MMQGGYYCRVVDIPFLVKNNLPSTTHLLTPLQDRGDSILVQSYGHITMSAPNLFSCGENLNLTREINCLGIKQQALRLHADIYFPGL